MRHPLALRLALVVSIACAPALGDESRFRLQVLHFADMDGDPLAALDNVRNLSALVERFRREYPGRTLVLSSGDNYAPGPRYEAASDDSMRALLGVPGPARGDIALLNALGVSASALGNHELDAGVAAFVGAISPAVAGDGRNSFPGARFPYLAANVDFAAHAATDGVVAPSGQPVSGVAGRLAASATVMLGGETIGLVGGVTPEFDDITTTEDLHFRPAPFDSRDGASLDALAAELQGAVDDLTTKGIDKIILLTHMQQLSVDRALAPRLRDVDIIIAGGSNTLLADADDRLWPGDEAAGPYPLRFESPTGETTLVLNTAGDYRYLGRLVVDFDAHGRIVGSMHRDDAHKGSHATDAPSVVGDPVAAVAAIADALEAAIHERSDVEPVGYTSVLLEGRREMVRTRETNLGNLIADAILDMARSVDTNVVASLIAGGGVRASIDAGPISQVDIERVLRFNNDLVLLTVTAEELAAVVEHAVAAVAPGDTPGRFPQLSGLQVRFDPARPGVRRLAAPAAPPGADVDAMARVRSLLVTGPSNAGTLDTVVEDGALRGDRHRTFRVVTDSHLAGGGDSYPFPRLSAPGPVNLREVGADIGRVEFSPAGTAQDALAEYLRAHFFDTPFDDADGGPSSERRIGQVVSTQSP